MNRKTHEFVGSPELDKDSDEPEGYDDRVYNLEEHDSPIIIRSKKSESPIGISLSDIIEGEEDGDEEEEQADATNNLNSGETVEKTRKRPPEEEFNTSHFFIKACMYGIILSAWGLIVFYLNLPLEEGIAGVQGSELITTFLGFMSIVSFYNCSNASSVNPTQKMPPYVTLSNKNFCDFCQKWKPERTHHCRSCGQCILRMDHHCFWICNCVGYRNHKAFLLFCLYTGLGSLYFDYRALYFFIWEAKNHSVFNFSAYFLIFALVCLFIVLPVGLMALGLAVYHFVLALNNLTTLETLSGINIINPLHITKLKPKKHINKYDNGVLANLSNFFGNSYLLWWWPTIPKKCFKGQVFVQINEAQRECEDSTKDQRDITDINKLKPNDIKEIDVEKILKQAEDYTKDKNLEFDTDAIDREKEEKENYQYLEASEMKDPYIPRRKSFHETEEALRIIQNMKEEETPIYYDEDFDEVEKEQAKDINQRTGLLANKERPKELSISTQASVEDRRKKDQKH